jgi:hypothetical protein
MASLVLKLHKLVESRVNLSRFWIREEEHRTIRKIDQQDRAPIGAYPFEGPLIAASLCKKNWLHEAESSDPTTFCRLEKRSLP